MIFRDSPKIKQRANENIKNLDSISTSKKEIIENKYDKSGNRSKITPRQMKKVVYELTCNYCNSKVLPNEWIYTCKCKNILHSQCLLSKKLEEHQNYKLESNNESSEGKQQNNINSGLQFCSTCNEPYQYVLYEESINEFDLPQNTNINNLKEVQTFSTMAFNVTNNSFRNFAESIKDSTTLVETLIEEENDNENNENENNEESDPSNKKYDSAFKNVPILFPRDLSSVKKSSIEPNFNSNKIIQNTNFNDDTPIAIKFYSPEKIIENVRQHLKFQSPDSATPYKLEDKTMKKVDKEYMTLNKNNSHSMEKMFDSILDSTKQCSSIRTDFLCKRNLSFKNNELSSFDYDEDLESQENRPSIYKDFTLSYLKEKINSPLEIETETGISHIITGQNKIEEIPINVTIKMKDEFETGRLIKSTILIFNTKSLNINTIMSICDKFLNTMDCNDCVFTNLFQEDIWVGKDKFILMLNKLILDWNKNKNLPKMKLFDVFEIIEIFNFAIAISKSKVPTLFSTILLSDILEVNDSFDVSVQAKKLLKCLEQYSINYEFNFSFHTILLNNISDLNLNQKKAISFLNQISNITNGLFFSAKDNETLFRCFNILNYSQEHSRLMNVTAIVIGNKDPSIFLDVLNFPYVKTKHNNYKISIGNLLRNETKILNLSSKVILTNENGINKQLPLFENKLANLYKNISDSDDLLRLSYTHHKTPMSKSFVTLLKQSDYEPIISKGVYIRNCCANLAKMMKDSVDLLSLEKNSEALATIEECKTYLTFNMGKYGIINFLDKLFIHDKKSLVNNNNSNNFNVSDIDFSKLTCESITNALKFLYMFTEDITFIKNFIQNIMIKKNNSVLLSELYTVVDSLMFYTPVYLSDNRFYDDYFGINKNAEL